MMFPKICLSSFHTTGLIYMRSIESVCVKRIESHTPCKSERKKRTRG